MKNGILPIRLTVPEVEKLLVAGQQEAFLIEVNLEEQTVTGQDGEIYSFSIDPYYKKMLLNGWDEIELTFQYEDKITAYEEKQKQTI